MNVFDMVDESIENRDWERVAAILSDEPDYELILHALKESWQAGLVDELNAWLDDVTFGAMELAQRLVPIILEQGGYDNANKKDK